jgi:hypothetical protein
VISEADLAGVYGVPVKRLNERVKRNARRFPADFVFRLTRQEAATVLRSRSQNATLKRGQNVKYLSFAFTEHGAIQAAKVIESTTAAEMGVAIVRAFARIRQLVVNNKAIAAQLAELDAASAGTTINSPLSSRRSAN